MNDLFDDPKEEPKAKDLYPELSEAGALAAESVIERAKKKLKDVCEEALGEIYLDIPSHIKYDSWTNFRNDMMDGFKNYQHCKVRNEYDFKEIRAQIFYQFREEIIKDLDQDNLAKIKRLEEQISHLQEMLRYR